MSNQLEDELRKIVTRNGKSVRIPELLEEELRQLLTLFNKYASEREQLYQAKLSALTATHLIGKWEIKEGVYYTIARNDLEFYQVIRLTENEVTFQKVLPEVGVEQHFPREGFVDKGFGLERRYVLDQAGLAKLKEGMK